MSEATCSKCNGPVTIEKMRKWEREAAMWFDVVRARCTSTEKVASEDEFSERMATRRRGQTVNRRCNHVEELERIPLPDVPPPTLAPAPGWSAPPPPPRKTVPPAPPAAKAPQPEKREEKPTMNNGHGERGKALRDDGTYDPDQKRFYIRQVLEGKMSASEAAQESGIHLPTLQAYVREERKAAGRPKSMPKAPAAATEQPPVAAEPSPAMGSCFRCNMGMPLDQLRTRDEKGRTYCADCSPSLFREREPAAPPAPTAPAAAVSIPAALVDAMAHASKCPLPTHRETATALQDFASATRADGPSDDDRMVPTDLGLEVAVAPQRTWRARSADHRAQLARLIQSPDVAAFLELDDETQDLISDLIFEPAG